jgi:hypothetical protein
MQKGFVFWLLMLLWLIFGAVMQWPGGQPRPAALFIVDSLLLFVLLFILGWAVFGFMIQ